MKSENQDYADLQRDIDRANRHREEVTLRAFAVFESALPDLAEQLQLRLRGRRAAAFWMAHPSRALDGESGYAVLATGQEERLWSHLEAHEMS
jgi:hypothetical protein